MPSSAIGKWEGLVETLEVREERPKACNSSLVEALQASKATCLFSLAKKTFLMSDKYLDQSGGTTLKTDLTQCLIMKFVIGS